MKFLGEIPDAQAEEAAARLRRLQLAGAQVTVKGVGAFPRPSRPSVIWVGVAPEDEAKVNPLAKSVMEALDGIGERDDRPFVAHVTVARVRSGRNTRALESVLGANSNRVFGTVRLGSLRLVSSQLSPRGPVYTDLEVYNLR